MYKMAVIGETESILAFRAIGFDTFIVRPGEAAGVIRKKFESGKYAVLFLTEQLAQSQSQLVEEYADVPYPVITVIPDIRERMFIGLEHLREISIKATGTDIVSKLK